MSSSGVYGTYQGTVINNVDPLGQSRLLLQVPQVLGTAPSNWAIPTVPAPTVPKVRDQVWVHFAGGDTNRPIYAAAKDGSIQVGDTTDGFFVLPTGITAYHNGAQTFDLDSQGNVSMVGKFQTGITGARVEMVAYNAVRPGSFDGNVISLYTGSPSEVTPAQISNGEVSTTGGQAPSLTLLTGVYSGASVTGPVLNLIAPVGSYTGEIDIYASEVDIGADTIWMYGHFGTGTGTLTVQTETVNITPAGNTVISGTDLIYNGSGQVNLFSPTNISLTAGGNGQFYGTLLTLHANNAVKMSSGYGGYAQADTSGGVRIGDNYNYIYFRTHDIGTNYNPFLQGGGNSAAKFGVRAGIAEIQSRGANDAAYGQFTGSNFLNTSARQFKTDIQPWTEEALDHIRATPVYSYRKHVDTAEDGTKIFGDRLHYGPILDEMPKHVVVDDEVFDISSVLGLFWKALQELDEKKQDKG